MGLLPHVAPRAGESRCRPPYHYCPLAEPKQAVTPDAALAFVRRHGVVLASGKGPVPNIAEAVAGEPIRGSWWSHARGRDIFRVLGALGDSPNCWSAASSAASSRSSIDASGPRSRALPPIFRRRT